MPCSRRNELAPAEVRLARGVLLQPDLLVLPTLRGGATALDFTEAGQLLLAVEVISPSSAATDRDRKRRLFLTYGVRRVDLSSVFR